MFQNKFQKLAILILFVTLLNDNLKVNSCDDHGHAHHHHHHHHEHDEHIEEKPAFKYSRAANEQPKQHHGHAHAHSHGGHDHGHAHAHSHGGHDHGHAHAHSHGGHDHGHAHAHAHSHESPKKSNEKRSVPNEEPKKHVARDKFSIALHACLSTLLISIAPFLILFFIPLNNNKVENQSLLKVLLGFASGSLLGDAFLHLIPHALHPHDHTDQSSHSHSHTHAHDEHDHSSQTIVGLWVLAGILAFLLVEKVVRNLNGEGHVHTHTHSHSHSSGSAKKAKNSDDESDEKAKENKDAKKDEKKKKVEEEKTDVIQVAGYLNLAADFAHNFTDGLAIGASFLAGQNIGIVTTLTILFHEVPHEIGDFAILIQSGCSKRKAIFLQLFTALGALSGTLLSLLFESAISGFATSCILPFTAGGFIYIATVTIIPELKENSSFFQSIKEILALATGVAMMVVIAYIE